MKKSVKILIILNLITYISSFLFSFFYTYAKEDLVRHWGVLGVWTLSPLLFITITTFILATDNKEEYKIFKKEAIADWIIRFVSTCIVFREFNFKFLSYEYIVQQSIVVILLIINMILEFKMYKKAKAYIPAEKNDYDREKISEDEKQNIRNMGMATTTGLVSFLVFTGLGLSILESTHTYENVFPRVGSLVFSVGVFLWFLQKNYEKCKIFYLDKSLAKKVFKKDAIYTAVGFMICFFIEVLKLSSFMPQYKIYFSHYIIAILFLYPTIKTNRKMALRYRKVVKILGDNFELYLNCNDN